MSQKATKSKLFFAAVDLWHLWFNLSFFLSLNKRFALICCGHTADYFNGTSLSRDIPSSADLACVISHATRGLRTQICHRWTVGSIALQSLVTFHARAHQPHLGSLIFEMGYTSERLTLRSHTSTLRTTSPSTIGAIPTTFCSLVAAARSQTTFSHHLKNVKACLLQMLPTVNYCGKKTKLSRRFSSFCFLI